MRKRIQFTAFAILFAVLSFTPGCGSRTVTLEPGGAYTDPTLVTADDAIRQGTESIKAFLAYEQANETYLAKWPEVHQFAVALAAKKNSVIKTAYEARDAYASAAKTWRDAVAVKDPNADALAQAASTKAAEVTAALTILNDLTQQIVAYKAAHAQ